MSIKLEIHRIGDGECSLTKRTAAGVEVTIENEEKCFLSWGGLKQLLHFKTRTRAGSPLAAREHPPKEQKQ